jgi:hypothetical protein
MRPFISIVLGAVGLWFFVPGLLSVIAFFRTAADAAPVPAMGTSLMLGSVLLVGSVMHWRGRPQRAEMSA